VEEDMGFEDNVRSATEKMGGLDINRSEITTSSIGGSLIKPDIN